jgi:3'-5' exoribonuclease
MQKIFVRDLIADSQIESVFLLNSWSIRKKRNGDDYLTLNLRDKSGEVNAVLWDDVDAAKSQVETGVYVWVVAKVGVFNDRKQLTLQSIRRVTENDVNQEDFVAVSDKDISSLWKQLETKAESIGHLHLRNLLISYIEDQEFAKKFRQAPAAMGFHHTYQGGLLEHTLSMMDLAEMIANHYEVIDRDLLITGVFLHDSAKIDELNYEKEYSYSDEGKLLGHIIMSSLEAEKRMADLGFPEMLRNKVLHLIISHHGEEQYGSPKKPMIPEAVALHYIDLIDSRMEMVREALNADAANESMFTEFHRGLGVSLFRG